MRDALETRLNVIALTLNDDELAVVVAVAERLSRGRTSYGPLDLATDPRDFVAEAGEEALDGLAYLAKEGLRRRRINGTPR